MQSYFYFSSLTFRSEPFSVDPVQAELCRAHQDGWPDFEELDDDPEIRVVVNTAFLNAIIPIGVRMLVDRKLGLALSRISTVGLRAVNVVDAFRYEVRLGTSDYQVELLPGESTYAGEIAQRFAAKFRCPPPRLDLVLLEPFNLPQQSKSLSDACVIVIDEPAAGIPERECLFSKRSLAEQGMMWSSGYWCTPEVWRLLEQWMDYRAFYWRQFDE